MHRVGRCQALEVLAAGAGRAHGNPAVDLRRVAARSGDIGGNHHPVPPAPDLCRQQPRPGPPRRRLQQQKPAVSPRPYKRTGRNPLPPELPRIEHRHEPDSCTCGQCGKDLIKIGEDISEQLDVEPARFFVHRHIRPQYACRGCETISAAPIPAAIIDGGLAAPGLLTWVVISKFMDHLPLYRLEQIAARQQVPLARSTLAEWVGRVGVALQPLGKR